MATASRARTSPKPGDKRAAHRDLMTDKDGAPFIEPLKPRLT
ncbi:hypothetical protein [Streptomyces sp. NBC_00859]|nr:hypothetical protein OG584_01380 [Streptomyces sp. NBC_00859]